MTIHESTNPRNSRISASTEFARDVFAWQEQIHTDRETIPNAKPISAFDFRLAYAITQYTNKHSRKAWPKQETLAADLGVDVRTVGRGIANLVRRGDLSVTRRGREQSAIYRMILQDRTSVSDHDEVRQDTDVRSKPQDKTSVSSRPDTGVLKTGHQCLIEPLLEPLLEPEERGAPQARPTIVDDGDDGIGVALRAPPPDHLERGFEHKSEQARWHGKVIDQDGVEFKPPPPHQRRPVPKDWWEAAMEGMNRGGRA
jgi:Helix-turn-helix domain